MSEEAIVSRAAGYSVCQGGGVVAMMGRKKVGGMSFRQAPTFVIPNSPEARLLLLN